MEPLPATAFDFSNTLSTHSIFGTLLEGILGYQEAPSVSEVAVWLIYLIPALLLFSSRRVRHPAPHGRCANFRRRACACTFM